MTADHLDNVRGKSVHDGVGDEDSSEVVRRKGQRFTVSVGRPGGGQRIDQQFADRGRRESAALRADAALEQQRIGGFQTFSRTS
ncbi:hypothetical protein ACFVXE_04245 [Streptomyces sp. NPDC058231]|uniref:hypothetical protein n=1 Tax=Streptomyces sp. NPDC058231 TaxID=3346392 RepID=UPI0036E0472D